MQDMVKNIFSSPDRSMDLSVGLIRGNSQNSFYAGEDYTKVNKYFSALEESLDHEFDILVAPEYNLIPNVPYTVGQKDVLLEELREMSLGHDTLFLPGTFFWKEDGKLINTLPIFHNGEQIYSYDKMRDGGEVRTAHSFYLEYRPGTEPGVFTHKGLKIGVEVCRDHYEGVLKENGIKDLDLQVMPSCGMHTHQNNFVTREGGYVMLCDGHYQKNEFKARKGSYSFEDVQVTRTYELDAEKLKLDTYHITID